jgi:hypothetical protein
MKQCVLDINVILDLWLERGDTTAIETLVMRGKQGYIRCWVTACSIPILEYVCISYLKQEGARPKEAKQIARDMLAQLLEDTSVLGAYDPSHASLLLQSRDLEDAQISLVASTLPDPKCIVTGDGSFDTLGKVIALSPEKALEWLDAL